MKQLVLDEPITIDAFFQQLHEKQLVLTEQNGDLVLRSFGGQLKASDISKIREDSSIVDFIKENKTELVAYLAAKKKTLPNGKVDLEKISSIYELSPLQEGMLFHDLYDRELNTYTEQFKVDFPSGVDKDILRKSLKYILDKHSILRSSFIYDKLTVPVQCVYNEVPLPFFELNLVDTDKPQQQEMIEAFYKKDRKEGFDFEKPPLMRFTLIKLTSQHYRMVWTYNHILIDGWSLQVLVGELLNAYQVFSKGGNFAVEEDRYEDFIKYIKTKDITEAQAFWTKYMEGFETPTLLPFLENHKESTRGRGVAEESYLEFDEGFSSQISNYAQNNQITVSTLIQGVWSFLLSKYTGSKDTIFGVTVSGRPADLDNAEERVGLYINALPLRSRLAADQKIPDWLSAIQKEHTHAREYQYNSLNDIQKWNNIEGALFDSIIVFEKYPVGELLSQDWLLKADNAVSRTQNNYTLSIKVSSGKNLSIVFSYYQTLLDEYYAEMIKRHFENILRQIVNNTCENTEGLKLLTAEEEKQLTLDFNPPLISTAGASTFLDLFNVQVKERPDAISVMFGESAISYRQLDEQSNQLANYLLACGIKKNECVGICMSDYLDKVVIAIFGILKSGAAYLPVDTELPQDRINYMLEEARIKILISHHSCGAINSAAQNIQVIFADTDWDSILTQPVTKPLSAPSAEDLAYVIYTSGSTGKPKGVMVTHHNLADYLVGAALRIPIPGNSSYGLMSTFSADLGNTVLFGSLINGGKLHLFTKELLSDAVFLHGYFLQHKIDVIKIVPSHWRALETESGLLLPAHTLVFGGEALNARQLQRIIDASPGLNIFNHYGPTETTIGKLVYKIDNNKIYSTIPVGQVFSNSRAYVVTEDLSICPVGVLGELLLGGDGVARGYLNQPEITRQKFIQDPFCKGRHDMVYRTGDMVRRLPDGNIEFCGRADNQVKIRGYRIEIGEIQSVLEDSEMVQQSVVVAMEDENGDNRLVAYIVAGEQYAETELKKFLASRLPNYMVPSLFIELKAIPLNANGKINRKALPKAEMQTTELIVQAEAVTENEKKLLHIWKEVLKNDNVGINDDFFELGGHSLTAIRLIGRINKTFSVKIPIGAIYTYTTIALQAKQFLTATADDDNSKLIAINKGAGKRPLFFIPGSSGSTLVYEALGKQLGQDQPFYTIQPKGFNGKAEPFTSMEAMASDFIKLIQQVDPRGPYCIGGYSFGGPVAYEMALQLRRKGFEVAGLIILDSISPLNKITSEEITTYEQWICSSVAVYEKYYGININVTVPELTGYTKDEQIAIVAAKLKAIGMDIPAEQLKGFINVSLSNDLISATYKPDANVKPDIPVLLLKSSEQDPERAQFYEGVLAVNADMGWKELVSGPFTIHNVPGNHHSFLFSPNVEVVAELLKSIL